MMTTTTNRRPGGRTELNRIAVYRAVVAALQSHGINFSYSDVAERSGVSRRTLHRRWPDRNTLIYEVLRAEYGAFEYAPRGNLAEDLREFGLKFRDFSSRPTSILVDGLAALAPDAEFSRLSQQAFEHSTMPIRGCLADTRTARGLVSNTAVDHLLGMLICPIVVSCSILREPMSDSAVVELAHLVYKAAIATG